MAPKKQINCRGGGALTTLYGFRFGELLPRRPKVAFPGDFSSPAELKNQFRLWRNRKSLRISASLGKVDFPENACIVPRRQALGLVGFAFGETADGSNRRFETRHR